MSDFPEQLRKLAPFLSCWENGETGLPTRDDELLLAAANEIETLRKQAEEAKRDEYHCIANAYATWAGDILELLEERLGELDIDNPSDEALKRLMDRAEAGIASEVRLALRQDEGDDE